MSAQTRGEGALAGPASGRAGLCALAAASGAIGLSVAMWGAASRPLPAP